MPNKKLTQTAVKAKASAKSKAAVKTKAKGRYDDSEDEEDSYDEDRYDDNRSEEDSSDNEAVGGCDDPSSIAETFRNYDDEYASPRNGHGESRINEAAQLLTMDDLNSLFDIFTKADRSGDGVCSKDELIDVFNLQDEDDEEKIELMMDNLDENGNGEVDFAEFVNWGSTPEAVVLSEVEQNYGIPIEDMMTPGAEIPDSWERDQVIEDNGGCPDNRDREEWDDEQSDGGRSGRSGRSGSNDSRDRSYDDSEDRNRSYDDSEDRDRSYEEGDDSYDGRDRSYDDRDRSYDDRDRSFDERDGDEDERDGSYDERDDRDERRGGCRGGSNEREEHEDRVEKTSRCAEAVRDDQDDRY